MKRGLQLLTLAPLIGCTDLLIKALGIGLAGLLLIPLCALLLAPLRARLSDNGLVLAALLIGATLASCAELTLQLFSAELANALALFLPLLALPCLAQTLDEDSNIKRAAQAGLLFTLTALSRVTFFPSVRILAKGFMKPSGPLPCASPGVSPYSTHG